MEKNDSKANYGSIEGHAGELIVHWEKYHDYQIEVAMIHRLMYDEIDQASQILGSGWTVGEDEQSSPIFCMIIHETRYHDDQWLNKESVPYHIFLSQTCFQDRRNS